MKRGAGGAEERLAAPGSLRERPEDILMGEAPYDVFVRWKPLEKMPDGWDPDLVHGVRANVRPFMTPPDIGRKGEGVPRDRPDVEWGKGRRRDAESAPWYRLDKGDRINDRHMTLAEKRKARG
jgi:hypothetical protein